MSRFHVLQGDYGGQIYLTVPVIGTGRQNIDTLLSELDAIAWPDNEGDGASRITGDNKRYKDVSGGMGGGRMVYGAVWMHEEFRGRKELRERICSLLSLSPETPFFYGDDKTS